MNLTHLINLPVHPYAAEFPLLPADELEQLAQDIKENGLQHPIVLWNGQLLDGRCRLQALQMNGAEEAETKEFDGDDFAAANFVRSLNINRRHLTVGQRAMAALAFLPYEEAEAAKRQEAARLKGLTRMNGGTVNDAAAISGTGKSRDAVAEKFNLSGQRVQEAKRLSVNAPDLVEDVKSGVLTLDGATKQLKQREERARLLELDEDERREAIERESRNRKEQDLLKAVSFISHNRPDWSAVSGMTEKEYVDALEAVARLEDVFTLMREEGMVFADRLCDRRCLEALGELCVCGCAGKNHSTDLLS